MYSNFLIYTFFYFFILLSIVGFGFLFSNLLFKKNNQNNFGYLGLIGILFLIIYSYISNFFIPHSKLHNLGLILVGFFLFCYYFYNNIKLYLRDVPLIFFVFLILLFSSLLFKTHDDFEYYHFPYSYYLTQYDFIFGIGHLNHGFRTPSSIFYLNSLFFLPKIDYYFFHMSPVYIMGFVNLILLKKILYFEKKYNFDFIKAYSLLSFLFINIFFYRIAEHGTDRTAQILVFLLILELLLVINYSKFQKEGIKFFFILLAIIISLKAFYILYILFLVPVAFIFIKKKPIDFINVVIKNSCFIILTFTCLLVFFSNFINTGCIIYPISITCLTTFDWSLPLDEVNRMRQWYELWAKAGAGPNFRIDNVNEYLIYFNWIPNWIDKYFFNKVSDFLLGIIFISFIFYFAFKSKIIITDKKKYNITSVYIIIIILWLEWLINHPALRYGGYHLFSLIIFIPLANYLIRFEDKNNIIKKKIYLFVCLALLIFVLRNTSRLSNEIKVYNYKPFSGVYYSLSDNGFRIQKKINKTIENYKMCTKNKENCDSNLVPNVKLFSGKYIFTVKND